MRPRKREILLLDTKRHKAQGLRLKVKREGLMIIGIVLLWMILCLGCASVTLQFASPLFSKFSASMFEECDSQLAKTAIPAQLKMLEGLLKSDPENREALVTLSMGFSGYSLLYVEDEDPGRASALYLRARTYGLRALGDKGKALGDPQNWKGNRMYAALEAVTKKELEALFWTTVAWNAWINLNLDKPSALAQLGIAQACLERVLQLDANYFYGMPDILMGISLSARPQMFGGDVGRAKAFFEKALALTQRKFLLAQYYYARYYAVRTQDKTLFLELIEEISRGKPETLKDVCLINTMAQEKAMHLKAMSEELFF